MLKYEHFRSLFCYSSVRYVIYLYIALSQCWKRFSVATFSSVLKILYSMVRASRDVSIIIQQDATEYSLFKSINCSTCFGWYLHPSSRAHITVSTVYGVTETVTATCGERDWTGTAVLIQSRSRQVAVTVSITPDTVDTVIWAPDDGWRYHPKHVEQFADINKLYIVALNTLLSN